MLKSLFDFFVFSNLWICFIVVAMGWHSAHTFCKQNSVAFYLLLFFSTATSYGFHWYLSSHEPRSSLRSRWAYEHKRYLFISSFLSATICSLILVFNFSLVYYLWPSVLLAFLYSAPKLSFPPFLYLRKLTLDKTMYLSLVWTYVVAVFPICVLVQKLQREHWLYIFNRFLFIYLACTFFDYRDAQHEIGVKNLMSYLSVRKLFFLLAIITLLFGINLFFLQQALSIKHGGIFLSLLLPFLLLLLTARVSLKSRSDYWYYGFIDGILAMPSLVLYMSMLGILR